MTRLPPTHGTEILGRVHAQAPGPLPRFDPEAPAFTADPYTVYRRLRAAGRLARGGPGQWVFARHADVVALLRDTRLRSEFPSAVHRAKLGDGPAHDFFSRIVIDRDPPEHTRLRQGMARAFTPAAVRDLGPRIRQIVDELLAPALDRGHLDLVSELAYPLPVTVVCAVLGIPPEDRDLVRPRMIDLSTAFGALSLSDAQRAAADEAVVWLRGYLGGQLRQRRRRPGEDQLSRLLDAEAEGLTPDEIIDNAIFLFFAGFETTMSLIGNGVVALLRHPDQLLRLRKDRSLLPTAVEELLRYDPPIQMSMRLVREAFEIAGRTIRTNRVVVLLLGSANRDEQQFPDPERLDLSRRPNPHVSFGGGHHYCLGASLARLEGMVVLDRLLSHFGDIELGGVPARRRHTSVRSYGSVPLSVRPA